MKSWIVIVTVMLTACSSAPTVQPVGDVNRSLKVVSLSAGVLATRADAYKAATELCAAQHESALVMGFDDDYGAGVGARSTTVKFSCNARLLTHP